MNPEIAAQLAAQPQLNVDLTRRVTYTVRAGNFFGTRYNVRIDGEIVGSASGSRSKGWRIQDVNGELVREIAAVPSRALSTPGERFELADVIAIIALPWL